MERNCPNRRAITYIYSGSGQFSFCLFFGLFHPLFIYLSNLFFGKLPFSRFLNFSCNINITGKKTLRKKVCSGALYAKRTYI